MQRMQGILQAICKWMQGTMQGCRECRELCSGCRELGSGCSETWLKEYAVDARNSAADAEKYSSRRGLMISLIHCEVLQVMERFYSSWRAHGEGP